MSYINIQLKYHKIHTKEGLKYFIISEMEEEIKTMLNGDKLDFNPLYFAILTQNIKIIKLLLDNGYTDILSTSHNYSILSCIDIVIFESLDKILLLILKYIDDLRSLLFKCIKRCKNVNTIKIIVDNMTQNDLNKSKIGEHHRSLLIFAVMADDLEKVKYIIEKFGNINHRDIFGKTALHYAVINKNIEICSFLLSYGADPTIRNYNGESSMHIICKYNNLDLTLIALFQKYSLYFHQSLLYIASEMNKTDIVNFLIESNADF